MSDHEASDNGESRSTRRSPISSRRRPVGNPREVAPPTSRCLAVFGLSMYTEEHDLRNVFTKYGPIEDVQMAFDTVNGRSRGFALVYFENQCDAEDAKEQCNGLDISRRKIRVDYSITQIAVQNAATISAQASSNEPIVNTMSDVSSIAPSECSFDNQENTNGQKLSPRPKATRGRRARAVKPPICEEDRELIASLSKRNKHIDMPALDDIGLLFSAQKERLQFSIKKKLHESTSKRVDTSPILSPGDAQANIDASTSSQPYNMRKKKTTTCRRGNLFN